MPSTRSSSRYYPVDSQISQQSATLPPNYSIILPIALETHTPTKQEHSEAYTTGQELLSDAIRKKGEIEGRLEDIKRRRVVTSREGLVVRKQKVQVGETLWYTVELKYPCICRLERYGTAHVPAVLPPDRITVTSSPNDSQPVPKLGNEIPSWESSSPGPSRSIDTYNDLPEFEHQWTTASGILWRLPKNRRDKGKARADGKVFSRVMPYLSSFAAPSVVDLVTPRSGMMHSKNPNISDQLLADKEVVIASLESSEEKDWREESKRRKQWWREVIASDGGYGKIWNILPPPYRIASPYIVKMVKQHPNKSEDFKLFRNYQTLSHPFHPDPHRYIDHNPKGLVYWLLPIHGYVIIPGLSDQVSHDLDRGQHQVQVERPTSWASRGVLSDIDRPSPLDIKERPKPLSWTGESIKAFVEIIKQWQTLPTKPFQHLTLVLSGPKPDPHIDLEPRKPMSQHQHNALRLPAGNEEAKYRIPVRPECGDHFRVYCYAEDALRLRTWLYRMALVDGSAERVKGGLGEVGSGGEDHGKAASWGDVFRGCRLALVGCRGEVILVV